MKLKLAVLVGAILVSFLGVGFWLEPGSWPELNNELATRNSDLGAAILGGVLVALAVLAVQQVQGNDAEKRNLQILVGTQDSLEGIDLSGRDLSGCYFRGKNMSGAKFKRTNLKGADLSYVDLRDANLEKADLRGTNLEEAKLFVGKGSMSKDAEVTDAKCDYSTTWPEGVYPRQVKACYIERWRFPRQAISRVHWIFSKAERRKSIVRRVLEEGWGQNPTVLDEVFREGATCHFFLEQSPDPKGLKQVISIVRAAFPDWFVAVEELTVEGNKASYTWTGSGRHRGAFVTADRRKDPTYARVTGEGSGEVYFHPNGLFARNEIVRFEGTVQIHWPSESMVKNDTAQDLDVASIGSQGVCKVASPMFQRVEKILRAIFCSVLL